MSTTTLVRKDVLGMCKSSRNETSRLLTSHCKKDNQRLGIRTDVLGMDSKDSKYSSSGNCRNEYTDHTYNSPAEQNDLKAVLLSEPLLEKGVLGIVKMTCSSPYLVEKSKYSHSGNDTEEKEVLGKASPTRQAS